MANTAYKTKYHTDRRRLEFDRRKSEKYSPVVLIGEVVYLKNEVPRVCRKCKRVFAGTEKSLYCHRSDCRKRETSRVVDKLVDLAVKPKLQRRTAQSTDTVKRKAGRPICASKPKTVVNCIACGTPFAQRKPTHTTCCRECYVKSTRKPLISMICEYCCQPFEKPAWKPRRFCSGSCAQSYRHIGESQFGRKDT
jgi:hypothetical protein